MSPTPAAEALRRLPLGTRVVVRYRIGSGFTDALGPLTALDSSGCTVATRRGAVVVPFELVVAAKQVPPAPQPRTARGGRPTD